MKAELKFNGGQGAVLCPRCRKILALGFEHDRKVYTCKCNNREKSWLFRQKEKYLTVCEVDY